MEIVQSDQKTQRTQKTQKIQRTEEESGSNKKFVKPSHIGLVTSIVGFLITAIALYLGFFFPILWFIMTVAVLCFSYWVYDYRESFKDFFQTKTTKSGLTHGASIALAVLVLIGVNFLGSKYNSFKDITSDRINTLSDESIKFISQIKDDVTIDIYFSGNQDPNAKILLKKLIRLYENQSRKISYTFKNAYENPEAASFLTSNDRGRMVLFVSSGGRREKVGEPIGEESLTTALMRLGGQSQYKIYFSQGHGEKSILDESNEGLSAFKTFLENRGFSCNELSLNQLQGGEFPRDLYALAIIGPRKNFSSHEVQILKQFIQDGGRLLLALEPDAANKSLNSLLAQLGVEYQSDLVVSVQSMFPLYVVGEKFSSDSELTKDMLNAQVIFPITSYFKRLDQRPESVDVQSIVSTSEFSFAVSTPQEVQEKMREISQKMSMNGQSYDIGLLVTGKLQAKEESHKDHSHSNPLFSPGNPFSLIVYGDSDFISNQQVQQYYNKDLALNSMVYLTGQKGWISIRPNEAQPTMIKLSPTGFNVAALFSFMPPLGFLLLAVFFWLRRRSL